MLLQALTRRMGEKGERNAGATHPCTRGSMVCSTPCSSCGLASLEGSEGRPPCLWRGVRGAHVPVVWYTLYCGRLADSIYRNPCPLPAGVFPLFKKSALNHPHKARKIITPGIATDTFNQFPLLFHLFIQFFGHFLHFRLARLASICYFIRTFQCGNRSL